MPEGRDAGRLDFPFVGIPSFLRSPLVQDLARLNADVAVLGVPTDEGSPFMPGSRFGPRSIREHSLRFVTDPPGFYDPQERRRYLEREMRENRIADVGDADILPTSPLDTFANITETMRRSWSGGLFPSS
jgi:agmatinase